MRALCLRLALTSFASFASLAPLAACKSPEVASSDLHRGARMACEKKDASSCFLAASLTAEESGGASRALRFHAKGCSLGHAGSCEALADVKDSSRGELLAEACNAGDLASCARLADVYANADAAKGRKLDGDVCRMALAVKGQTTSRDVAGISAACGKLAAIEIADPLRAIRLEGLSTLLQAEALARFEREQDARAERLVATPPLSALERARTQRESEAMARAREGLVAPPASKVDLGQGASAGPPLAPIEKVFAARALATGPASSGSAAADDAAVCRETGDSVACALAAAQAEKTDPSAALDLHTAGCAKRPEQCWSLVAYADGALRNKDGARASQVLEKGCELKSPLACARLAGELEQGERAIAQDLERAARFYDKACELGSARSCATLASLVDDGRGAPRSAARAKALRQKAEGLDTAGPATSGEAAADEEACRRRKDAARCSSAALAVQDVDAVRAEELLRVGCGASPQSCGLWSFALDRLRKDDASRGIRVLEQGCQASAPLACHALAEVLHLGLRVPRVEPKAGELYQRACELGDVVACRVAASRQRAGIGAAKNAAKADELHDRAARTDQELPAEKWARDAAEQRVRGPHLAELERARADHRALADKTRARAQRREERVARRSSPALSPAGREDLDGSSARLAAIRKAASVLGPAR